MPFSRLLGVVFAPGAVPSGWADEPALKAIVVEDDEESEEKVEVAGAMEVAGLYYRNLQHSLM